jgi:hypothetical protein
MKKSKFTISEGKGNFIFSEKPSSVNEINLETLSDFSKLCMIITLLKSIDFKSCGKIVY